MKIAGYCLRSKETGKYVAYDSFRVRAYFTKKSSCELFVSSKYAAKFAERFNLGGVYIGWARGEV